MKFHLVSIFILSFWVTAALAQSSSSVVKKHHRAHTMIKNGESSDEKSTDNSGMTTDNGVPISSAGAEVSGVTGSAPGDPYNLAHPFFNGDPRWSDKETMYSHGDFPWPMVSQHPESFNFNAMTGQWELTNPPAMGATKKTR